MALVHILRVPRFNARDALAAVGAATLLVAAARVARFLLSGGSPAAALRAALRGAVGGALAVARALPLAADALEAGLDGALDALRDELAPASATSVRVLPARARRASAIVAELRAALADDASRNGLARGTAFGGIYHVLDASGAAAASPGAGNAGGAAAASPGAGAGADADAGADAGGAAARALPLAAAAAAAPGAPDLHALHAAVAEMFLDTNMLYPGLFRAARRAEAESVAMAVALLRDGADGAGGGARAPAACGLLTSGGTESVLLAVKAHRDAALAALGFGDGAADGAPAVAAAARAGRVLTVVAGATAHPAFDKACALFGLRLRKLPVDGETLALAPAAVAAALDADTVLVVASAPGFAHGVVDDVAGIAAVAGAFRGSPWGARGVPVHVDNCLGGVLLSFLAAGAATGAGARAPPAFDFRAAPQVASISMDLHKYGGAPKGASVVAFRDAARRRAAYSATADFPGGLYATPTLAGSRGGAPAALAWATLLATGADGFARAAARVAAAHAALAAGIAATPGLQLLGAPHACVVAFAPARDARFSAYAVAARMEARAGWKVALLQAPRGAHVVVTERFAEPWAGGGGGGGAWTVGEQWLADLRAAVRDAAAAPHEPAFEGRGDAAIYGAAGALPEGEVDGILRRYCDVLTCVR
jgi:sphinganine-1-phosphate aldolase